MKQFGMHAPSGSDALLHGIERASRATTYAPSFAVSTALLVPTPNFIQDGVTPALYTGGSAHMHSAKTRMLPTVRKPKFVAACMFSLWKEEVIGPSSQ